MKRIFLALMGAFFISIQSAAALDVAQKLDAKAMADVMSIERYLNRLHTFKANFQQYVPGEPFSSGTFYLKRPGKFLWQYKKPHKQKLISDGGLIYFEDAETGQVTQVPKKGLASLLTQKTIRLNGRGMQVVGLFRQRGVIHLTIKLDDTQKLNVDNQIRLSFESGPLQLKQITTTNQLGQDVVVTFFDVQQNKPLKNSLFDYTPSHYEDELW